MNQISQRAIKRRKHWVKKIESMNKDFSSDTAKIQKDLMIEIKREGISSLVDHLRLCAAIPESCGHNSTEEKLYSKYTDILISASFSQIGLKSMVLESRGDSADVEVIAHNYSFVADAKVFRLSRTAKNQKDFKIQAMDNWKFGKPFAMVVCPLYQIPSKNSQIYQQASARNVCIFSYSHLAVLVQFVEVHSKKSGEKLLYEIFETVNSMNPSKSAITYWNLTNRKMLSYSDLIKNIWKKEKIATLESIKIAKVDALTYYAKERAKIIKMSRDEAISKLLNVSKIKNRVQQIEAISENNLMDLT